MVRNGWIYNWFDSNKLALGKEIMQFQPFCSKLILNSAIIRLFPLYLIPDYRIWRRPCVISFMPTHFIIIELFSTGLKSREYWKLCYMRDKRQIIRSNFSVVYTVTGLIAVIDSSFLYSLFLALFSCQQS